MLKVNDLVENRTLDRLALSGVCGGFNPFTYFERSVRQSSVVADVDQVFAFAFDQQNSGQVTNNQMIQGGNGIVYAPVNQRQSQGSRLSVFDVGNTSVSVS